MIVSQQHRLYDDHGLPWIHEQLLPLAYQRMFPFLVLNSHLKHNKATFNDYPLYMPLEAYWGLL